MSATDAAIRRFIDHKTLLLGQTAGQEVFSSLARPFSTVRRNQFGQSSGGTVSQPQRRLAADNLKGAFDMKRGVTAAAAAVALSVVVGTARGADEYSITDLGQFIPVGINNSGQVAGNSNFGACLYSNGSLTILGAFVAAGINDSAQVVGYKGYVNTAGTIYDHAFLYSNGTMTDLNSLIAPSSGWTLERANAINDSGQVAGYGLTSTGNGNQHAFLYSNGPMTNLGNPPGGVYSEALGSTTAAKWWASAKSAPSTSLTTSTLSLQQRNVDRPGPPPRLRIQRCLRPQRQWAGGGQVA